MTEVKHTPGPWVQKVARTMVHIHGQGMMIGSLPLAWNRSQGETPQTMFEREANAHLISAAPDLLENLIWAEMVIDNLRNGRGCGKIEGDDCQSACKGSIAKATGAA